VATPAFAARTSVSTIISTTTLDADPTSATGSATVKSADKIAFFVSYDETEVGGIQVAVTIDISPDGTNWYDASFTIMPEGPRSRPLKHSPLIRVIISGSIVILRSPMSGLLLPRQDQMRTIRRSFPRK